MYILFTTKNPHKHINKIIAKESGFLVLKIELAMLKIVLSSMALSPVVNKETTGRMALTPTRSSAALPKIVMKTKSNLIFKRD